MAALVEVLAGFTIGGLIALVIIYLHMRKGGKKETPPEQVTEELYKHPEPTEPIIDIKPEKRAFVPKPESVPEPLKQAPEKAEPKSVPEKHAPETNVKEAPIHKVDSIDGKEAKIADVLASPRAFEGIRVVLRACDVVPGLHIMGVYAHIISDESGKIDGFSKDMMEGHGDIGGTVKLTSTGSPYVEF